MFNDLMNLMDEINNIYLKLFRLELLGEINSSYSCELISELKKLLVLEDQMFQKFIKSYEYELVKEVVMEENSSVAMRFKEYITLYDNSENEENDEFTLKIRKLYATCVRNIFLVYLSLIQEYVDMTNDKELRERVLSLKYFKAFIRLDIGKLLIENNFVVSRENYVDVYLIADMIKLDDMNTYDIILDAYKSVLVEMMRQLFEVNDISYNDKNVFAASKNIELMIRAVFVLMSEHEYDCIKDEIFNIIDEFSNECNSISVSIVDKILDDRISFKGRVRKISLKPLDD